jgi:glycerol-3-phosphate dehydrogenase
MTMTRADVVLPRTGIGQLGPPAPGALDETSKLMADELGWDEARRISKIAAVRQGFETQESA